MSDGGAGFDWELLGVIAEGLWWAFPIVGGLLVLAGSLWERRPWRKTYADHAREYEQKIRHQVEEKALAELAARGPLWKPTRSPDHV